MDRWVEHYSGLSLRETVVNYAALNWITFPPVMDELDAEPTIQEFVLEYPSIKAENWTHLNNGPSGNNNLTKRAIFCCGGGLIFFHLSPCLIVLLVAKPSPYYLGLSAKDLVSQPLKFIVPTIKIPGCSLLFEH